MIGDKNDILSIAKVRIIFHSAKSFEENQQRVTQISDISFVSEAS